MFCKAFVAFFGATLCAYSQWVRLTAPGFELLTDAGAASGRAVLTRMDRIRTALDLQPTRPVRVVLFRSASDFARYQPVPSRIVAGFYTPGTPTDTIVLRSDRAAVHEYVHLVLNQRRAQIPLWFNEGTAEFYSTAEFSPKAVRIGAALPAHLAALKSRSLDLTALFKADPYDPQSFLYAEAWALVHMLRLHPTYAPHLQHFLDSLASGSTHAQSFLNAYGKTIPQVERDLAQYVLSPILPTSSVPAPPASSLLIEEHPISRAEALLALAPPTPPPAEAPLTDFAPPSNRPEIPPSWTNAHGPESLTGQLLALDCNSTEVRLLVLTPTGRRKFRIADPSKVVLNQAPGSTAELACGTLAPRKIFIEFKSLPGVDPEITALSFTP